MQELSLYILDIVQNSIAAGATHIIITLEYDEEYLTLTVVDNGCGMDEEMLEGVMDPFVTSRTTRKVGLGIPLLKESCEVTKGSFSMSSKVGEGTSLKAVYRLKSFDIPPIGNMGQTMAVLMCCNQGVNFEFKCISDNGQYTISTSELKEVLGDVPISSLGIGDFIERDVNSGILPVCKEDII